MIKLVKASKTYKDVQALKETTISLPNKGMVVIVGDSGSGKSTLLNLMAGNVFATTGGVFFNNVEISKRNAEEYRRDNVATVYQDFRLISDLSVYDNISLAVQAEGRICDRNYIEELLEKVGIARYADKKINKMSGGEMQRVAIARAIAKKDAIVLADEPTGNLDKNNSIAVMELLKEISKERLVVVVSHNEALSERYADYYI